MIVRCLAIVALLSAVATAQPVVDPKPIPAPGATGMNSSTDCGDLRATDAKLLQNTDATTYPGKLVGRKTLRNIGDNNVSIYGSAGLFNDTYGWKQLVGVVAGPTSISGPRNLDSTLRTYTLTDSAIRRVAFSNKSESGVQDSTLTAGPYLYPSAIYSTVSYPNQLIIADGQSIPISVRNLGEIGDIGSSDRNKPYKIGYKPSAIPLSLEAPGQLRVGLMGGDSTAASPTHSGVFEYRYKFINSGKNKAGQTSIYSRPVFANRSKIYAMGFEGRALSPFGSFTSYTRAVIERRIDGGSWITVDTILYGATNDFIWIDTVSDAASMVASTTTQDSIPRPGTLWDFGRAYDSIFQTCAGCAGGQKANAVDMKDTFYVAYSFYDPISGAESPIGPITMADSIVDSAASVVYERGLYAGTFNLNFRPRIINVYRSEKNDSTVLYSMLRLHADTLYTRFGFGGESWKLRAAYVGHATDLQLTSGTFPYSAGLRYHDYSVLRGSLGEVFTRPPYIQNLLRPLSSVTRINSRIWGVGDPFYRQRLYYSGFDAPYDWDALGYITLNEEENDECVAVVSSDYFHGLYVFKRNSIYAGSGSDPENDMVINRITNRHGAVNQRAVCSYGPMLYFLSFDLRAYSIGGQVIEDISAPIADQLASSFGSFANAQTNARVFPGDKCIFFVNRSTEDCFRYDLISGAWSKNTYKSGYVPVESFDYDTVSTSRGFGQSDRWYRLKSGTSLAHEVLSTELVDSLSGQSIFQPAYQTPCYGDGVHVFEIQRIVVSGSLSSNAYIKAVVVNEAGDSLCVDSVAATASAIRDYSIPLPPHNSKWVSAKITCSTNNQALTINDVTVYCRRVGNVARM